MNIGKKRIVTAIFLVVLMVAGTLFLIGIPYLYYKSQDKKEDKSVSSKQYNIEMVEKSLTLEEKKAILFDDNAIVTRDEAAVSDEIIEKNKSKLIGELDKLTVSYWNDVLCFSIGNPTKESFSVYRVLRSESGEVSSFNVVSYAFKSDILDYPSILLFDPDDFKILYADIIINSDKVKTTDSNQIYIDNLLDNIYDASQAVMDVEKLKEYYGEEGGWAKHSWSDAWSFNIYPNNPGKAFSDGMAIIINDCYSDAK